MIKFARKGGKQVQKEDFSEENVSQGRDTGDTNPKLLVNGYRLVSLSQWSPAPLSLVSNEQETHQCEAVVVEEKKVLKILTYVQVDPGGDVGIVDVPVRVRRSSFPSSLTHRRGHLCG